VWEIELRRADGKLFYASTLSMGVVPSGTDAFGSCLSQSPTLASSINSTRVRRFRFELNELAAIAHLISGSAAERLHDAFRWTDQERCPFSDARTGVEQGDEISIAMS
jgi:hypothetical protein